MEIRKLYSGSTQHNRTYQPAYAEMMLRTGGQRHSELALGVFLAVDCVQMAACHSLELWGGHKHTEGFKLIIPPHTYAIVGNSSVKISKLGHPCKMTTEANTDSNLIMTSSTRIGSADIGAVNLKYLYSFSTKPPQNRTTNRSEIIYGLLKFPGLFQRTSPVICARSDETH